MATPTVTYDKQEFRVCPITTFRVHRKAEPVMIVNAVVAILAMALGGIAALLMGLHKFPGQLFSLITEAQYYQVVTIHGINMLILWIVWFEIAAAYFVSTAILNSRLFSVPLAWVSTGLMLLGTLLLEFSIFFEPASWIMFTAYMPMVASPIFYLGYIFFAVGALVGGLVFVLTIIHAQKSGTYPHKALPLSVYGVFVAIVIAVQAILNGAIVMIIALLASLNIIDAATIDADLWKQMFWGFGHTAQYINISATAAVWYALIFLTVGAKPLSEKYSRLAFFLYLIFTVPVATHHLIVDPAYSLAFKMINATLLAFGLAIPSLIHAFVIPGAMEKKLREEGKSKDSLFGWIRALPWTKPGTGHLFWSILLFGVGGVLGAIQGTYQLNMIIHNTLRINAHFHLTVVAGTTMAFMGLAYYFMELIPRRKVFWPKLTALQPHIYGVGLALLSAGLFIAGVLGAPRRTATYDFYIASGLTLPGWDIGLWILGIGAIIAVAGGTIFVLQMVLSLFFGKKLPAEGDWSSPIPSTPVEASNGKHTKLDAPGTLAIGIGYLIIFMVWNIVTFLILSLKWPIGPGI